MQARGDRREVKKKHEDKCGMVPSDKKRGQREKDAGGLHACLKTTSCAAF